MKPEFDKYTGWSYKGGFHQDSVSKKQAKLSREIHSGVDPDEGINACRGMLSVCAFVVCIAIIAFTIWATK